MQSESERRIEEYLRQIAESMRSAGGAHFGGGSGGGGGGGGGRRNRHSGGLSAIDDEDVVDPASDPTFRQEEKRRNARRKRIQHLKERAAQEKQEEAAYTAEYLNITLGQSGSTPLLKGIKQSYQGGRSGQLEGKETSNLSSLNAIAAVTGKLVTGFQGVTTSAEAFSQRIGSLAAQLSALFNAQSLGLQSSIQQYQQYNSQLLAVSASYARMGVGISGTEAAMQRMRSATGLTYTETKQLMEAYASGFNFTSISKGEQLFNNLKRAVGSNAEAMQSLMQNLQGIIQKFPDLENMITRMDAFDKKQLALKSSMLVASGQMTLQESRELQKYTQQGGQPTDADAAKRAGIDKDVMDMKKVQQMFEDIAINIGKSFQPVIEQMAKLAPWLSQFAAGIGKVMAWIEGIGVGIGLVTTAFGALGSLLYTGYKTLTGLYTISQAATGALEALTAAAWEAAGAQGAKSAGSALTTGEEVAGGTGLVGGGAAVGATAVEGTSIMYTLGAATASVIDFVGSISLLPLIMNPVGAIVAAVAVSTVLYVRAANDMLNAINAQAAAIQKGAAIWNDKAGKDKKIADDYKQGQQSLEKQAIDLRGKGDIEGAKKIERRAAEYAQGSDLHNKLSQSEKDHADIDNQFAEEKKQKSSWNVWSKGNSFSQADFYKEHPELQAKYEANQTNRQALDKYNDNTGGLADINKDVKDAQQKEMEKNNAEAQAQSSVMAAMNAGKGKGGLADIMGQVNATQEAAGKNANIDSRGLVVPDSLSGIDFSDEEKKQLFANGGKDRSHALATDQAKSVVENKVSKLNDIRGTLDKNIEEAGSKEDKDKYTKQKEQVEGILKVFSQINDQQNSATSAADVQFNAFKGTLDTALHVQNQLIEGQSKLFEAQKGYVSSLVQTMQATGNVDMSSLTTAMHDALASQNEIAKSQQKMLDVQDQLAAMDQQEAQKKIDAANKVVGSSSATPTEKAAAQKTILEETNKQNVSSLAVATNEISRRQILVQMEQQRLDIAREITKAYDGNIAKTVAQIELQQQQNQLSELAGAGGAQGTANRQQIEADTRAKLAQQQTKLGTFGQARTQLAESVNERTDLTAEQKVEELKKGTQALDTDELNTRKEIASTYTNLVEVAKSYLEINKQNVEVAKSSADVAKSEVDLAENMGFGVQASAQLRMQYNQKLQAQLNEQKETQAAVIAQEKQARDALAAAKTSGNLDDINAKTAVWLEATKNVNSAHMSVLQTQMEMSNNLKSFRDNYLSAVAAINTGTGAITKVMTDQNKNMGSFLENTEGAVQALGVGGVTKNGVRAGYEGSSRFNAQGGSLTVSGPRGQKGWTQSPFSMNQGDPTGTSGEANAAWQNLQQQGRQAALNGDTAGMEHWADAMNRRMKSGVGASISGSPEGLQPYMGQQNGTGAGTIPGAPAGGTAGSPPSGTPPTGPRAGTTKPGAPMPGGADTTLSVLQSIAALVKDVRDAVVARLGGTAGLPIAGTSAPGKPGVQGPPAPGKATTPAETAAVAQKAAEDAAQAKMTGDQKLHDQQQKAYERTRKAFSAPGLGRYGNDANGNPINTLDAGTGGGDGTTKSNLGVNTASNIPGVGNGAKLPTIQNNGKYAMPTQEGLDKQVAGLAPRHSAATGHAAHSEAVNHYKDLLAQQRREHAKTAKHHEKQKPGGPHDLTAGMYGDSDPRGASAGKHVAHGSVAPVASANQKALQTKLDQDMKIADEMSKVVNSDDKLRTGAWKGTTFNELAKDEKATGATDKWISEQRKQSTFTPQQLDATQAKNENMKAQIAAAKKALQDQQSLDTRSFVAQQRKIGQDKQLLNAEVAKGAGAPRSTKHDLNVTLNVNGSGADPKDKNFVQTVTQIFDTSLEKYTRQLVSSFSGFGSNGSSRADIGANG